MAGDERKCVECGKPWRKGFAKNLCPTCYNRRRARIAGIQPRKYAGVRICRRCGGPKSGRAGGRGLCDRCYRALYNRALRIFNPEHMRARWKRQDDQRYFGGRRQEILRRFDYRCAECGMSNNEHRAKYRRGLFVHHKDGNGRGSREPNNSLDNLIVLCLTCHARAHELGANGLGHLARWGWRPTCSK